MRSRIIVVVEKQYTVYIYIFVGMRARACAHACARACGCVHVSLLSQHATRMHHVVTSLWTPLPSPHLLLYLTNGTIFRKKSLNIKRVFWFSLQLLFETFLIVRKSQRDIAINVKSLHVKYPLFLWDFNETWIFSTPFRKKSSKIRFYQNPSSGSRVVPCGQTDRCTDRHDEVNSRFSLFCECA